MYCRHCGRKIDREQNYCRYCGGQLHYHDRQNKNSYINTLDKDRENCLEIKKKQEALIIQERKKLRRETTLYTAFSLFVIVIFILSIIIIQNNSSLLGIDSKKETTQEFENITKDVSNGLDKIEAIKSVDEEEYKLGSAKLLDGYNILISIFVDVDGDEWTVEEKQYCKESLEEAVSWIEREGETYGKQIHFLYDMDSQSDLLYSQSIDFKVDSDSQDSNQYTYYLYNKLWIQENIDIDSITKKYGSDSIGYLFFVKDEGTSYTYSHYLEDKNINKEEMCTIYLEDSSNYGIYENPATYAHEILHLYGALDLYEDACPEKVNDYVINTYPYEIMLSTYDETLIPNEYNEVKMISPITAYMLNWIEEVEELTRFPEMEREEGACFSIEDFGGYYFDDMDNKEFEEVNPSRNKSNKEVKFMLNNLR